MKEKDGGRRMTGQVNEGEGMGEREVQVNVKEGQVKEREWVKWMGT